ncbi:hypothetical protein [Mesorhizobium sp. 43Arga]
MKRKDRARPFVPTEIHVATFDDAGSTIGILSIATTEGLLEIALDQESANAIIKAIGTIKSKLDPSTAR